MNRRRRLEVQISDPEFVQKNVTVIQNQLFRFRLYENQTIFVNDDEDDGDYPTSRCTNNASPEYRTTSRTDDDNGVDYDGNRDGTNRYSKSDNSDKSNFDDDEMIMIRIKGYLQMMLALSSKQRSNNEHSFVTKKPEQASFNYSRNQVLRTILNKLDNEEKTKEVQTTDSAYTTTTPCTKTTKSMYERICDVVSAIQKIRMTLSFVSTSSTATRKIPSEVRRLLFSTTLMYAYEYSAIDQFETIPWMQILQAAETNLYEFEQQYKKRSSSTSNDGEAGIDETNNNMNDGDDYTYDPTGKKLRLGCQSCGVGAGACMM